MNGWETTYRSAAVFRMSKVLSTVESRWNP